MEATENKKKKGATPMHLHYLNFPKTHMYATSALAVCLAALFSMTPSKPAEANRRVETVTLPIQVMEAKSHLEHHTATLTEQDIKSTEPSKPKQPSAPSLAPVDTAAAAMAQAPTAEPTPIEPDWIKVTAKNGDNLSLLFKRAGLNDRAMYEVLYSSKEARKLGKIFPGHTFHFALNNEGQLQTLKHQIDQLTTHNYSREGDSFNRQVDIKQPDVRMAFREATIDSSLFLAGQAAGMEASLIMEFANIFGWDVDFILDIRKGDTFSLLYEEKFLNGEKIGNGAIMAAEFTNQGKTFNAVRYTNASGVSNYFTPEGRSMRKAFIRTPVDFARISSHFNLRRKHPVLNRIRAHKGTDYAAPRGTPIKAAGDGKVTFAGRKGGYGNVVIIQHGQKYKTLYAHMHRFGRGIRVGARVKQSQTIGTVGATGLATGPHLHYEFYVNGAVRNPVTVSLPKASSIAKTELARFQEQTSPRVQQLASYQQRLRLASNDVSVRR